MKLAVILESDEERIKARIKRAYMGKGKTGRGGLFGIVDEFGCDLDTASKYLKIVASGTYGEHDIEDKTLHHARAPQGIYRLLKHFGVSERVAKKLIRFHLDHHKIVAKHLPSPGDDQALKQLMNKERLVALVTIPKERLVELGFVAKLVPWFDDEFRKSYPQGAWYIARPDNEDIIDEMISIHDGTVDNVKADLLHGLAFGYKMVDVFNYVRAQAPEEVDKICGHVDKLPR